MENMNQFGMSLTALGIAYLAALFMGRLAVRIHVPKVTAYLVLGLLLGPSLSHIVGYPALLSKPIVSNMDVLSDIALAFIMFTMGGQFKNESIRRWGKKLITFSASEIFITLFAVMFAFVLLNIFAMKFMFDSGLGLLGNSVYFALFIAIISVATAPAATLLVIREYESDGPITDLVLALVGQNNFVSIFLFNIFSFFLLSADGSFGSFVAKMFGPIVLGAASGFFASTWVQRLEKEIEQKLLLLGAVIANVGLAELLNLDIFLVSFFMGIMIVNSSPKATILFNVLKSIDYPLYVIFFILAGAHLHIQDLSHLGLFGIVYIVVRTGGKIFGNWLGAKLAGFGAVEQKWTGYAMLAQAGVAIGLSQTLAETWPGGGQMVQTVVLGSVVFFELVGPISVRHSLVQAGEVPIISLLAKRAPEGSYEGLHHVVEHFRTSLGVPSHHKIKSAADILVRHIMRKNVDTMYEDTHFNDILHLIAHSKYDRFPIVNKQNEFIGVVDYSDVRDLVVDPAFSQLVVAKDIVKPEPLALRSEQTLGEALDVFRSHSNMTYLPVVESSNPKKLVGILSQNDVLASFRKLESSRTK
jgi:Kef-type K+ transport system membrane component KefB/CBS domain-containing protein